MSQLNVSTIFSRVKHCGARSVGARVSTKSEIFCSKKTNRPCQVGRVGNIGRPDRETLLGRSLRDDSELFATDCNFIAADCRRLCCGAAQANCRTVELYAVSREWTL